MNRTNRNAQELKLLYREFPEHFVWRTLLSKASTAECEGPKSYEDLELRLFGTLLVYCNPQNLCKQFEEPMSEDSKLLPNAEKKYIQYQVFNHINDMGHNVNDYELIPEQLDHLQWQLKTQNKYFFERTITVSEEDVLLHKKLNTKQLKAYNVITARIFSKKPGAFFIDGPGGTGKSFLYRALLAMIRSKEYIALATTTSGVAASILPDIDEKFSCNISKQSSVASLIRDAKLIVWNEVTVTKKKILEVFNILLKDLMNTNMLFSGKVVPLEETLDKHLRLFIMEKEFINQSILYSTIWDRLEKFQLSENMRAKTDVLFAIT
ncbi:hypothetical protein H5410_064441 [Solanum commersonii]|uniref:ATP-dependent DNA helicase n=1 Tax=Solanum commersonii TaxID=4109 RepID=A0A9J5VZC0_SOLCO|nr:hypothetical protein H5410_064441 [Solanum commersonii]